MADREDDELRDWSSRRWPQVDWTDATTRHGAFHRLVLSAAGPIMRGTVGTNHADRAVRELTTARTVAGLDLSLPVPAVLAGLSGDDAMTAILIGRTPGDEGPGRGWDVDLGRRYRSLLDELAAVDPGLLGNLPEVRTWCGGSDWPQIVERVTAPLTTTLRQLADRLVREVLEVEAGTQPTMVHGDFGPHNILWERDRPASLIDFDHACVADPAIDVAPLVGAYGAAAVSTIVDRQLLERAMIHRATLSLQVACAAHLIGQQSLCDSALDNFVRRTEAAELYDPGGTRPKSH